MLLFFTIASADKKVATLARSSVTNLLTNRNRRYTDDDDSLGLSEQIDDVDKSEAYSKRGYVRIGRRDDSFTDSLMSRDKQHKHRMTRSVDDHLNGAATYQDSDDFFSRLGRGAFMRFGRNGEEGREQPLNYDDGFVRYARGNFMRFGR